MEKVNVSRALTAADIAALHALVASLGDVEEELSPEEAGERAAERIIKQVSKARRISK